MLILVYHKKYQFLQAIEQPSLIFPWGKKKKKKSGKNITCIVSILNSYFRAMAVLPFQYLADLEANCVAS